MLKNLKLRPKLIGSYMFLALAATLLAYFGVQLAFREIVTDAIPTLQITAQISVLISAIRGDTLEFVIGGDEEAVEHLNKEIDKLNPLLKQFKNDMADDAAEKEPFEQLAQIAEETSVVAQEIIQAHQQTLQHHEELDTLAIEADTLFDEAKSTIRAEIEQNLQAGNLAELRQNVFPSADYLDQFIGAASLLEVRALEFVSTGNEVAWEELLVAEARLAEAQAKLAPLLEADEAGEKDLLASLDSMAERLQLKSKEIIETHRRTLSRLAQLDQLHQELNDTTGTIELVMEEEVSGSVAATTRNILIVSGVVLSLAILLGVFLTNTLVRPIQQLVNVAEQIRAGDIAVRAEVATTDEIGTLAQTFNSMTAQLGNLIVTLEDRVAARTQQLETVVSVSQRLASILDVGDLLHQVVTITKETFNYYHVHIYLLDGRHEALNLTEGYGEPGAEMKRRGHNIPLAAPKSLVARAAREGRIITIENVRLNPDWLPNPLLPETCSEMAVPVMRDRQIAGVLDVQSETVGGLSQGDEAVLQLLANQIAIAIHNARLFGETRIALHDAQKLQQLYTGQVWERFSAVRTTDYEVRSSILPPLQEVVTPEAIAALQREQTVTLEAPTSEVDSLDLDNQSLMPSALATPLKLHNKIIGVLGFQDQDPNRRWTEDEIALIEAVSEQMSQAIEHARLFEETQRSAWRDQMVSESTAQVWSSAEIEGVMRAAVAQLGDKLRASEVVIRLGTEAELVQG